MIIISSCFSVITALLINFVSGFLLVSTYLIIITVNLLKEKQTKNTLALWISSIILFSLLATVICIIPTLKMNNEDKKIPESIEVIQGDGKNLNISPVYDHIKDTEPKPSSKKPKKIIIPKKNN